MSQSTDTSPSTRSPVANMVGVVADAQTYKNLLYLLLAFPLGMAYYIILMVGFTVGLGLSVLVVGLGILLATVIGLRYLASFERGLANTLLGTNIHKPDDVEKASEGIVGTAKAYLQASSTWRGLGFVALKFPIGLLSFVLLVTFLGTGVELLLIPLFPGGVSAGVSSSETPETDDTTDREKIEPEESEDVDDETTDSGEDSHADEAEAGICVVGADSPCNGESADGERIGNDSDDGKQIVIPEDQNRDGEIDKEQIMISEDQNRDGEINAYSIGEFSFPAPLSAILTLF